MSCNRLKATSIQLSDIVYAILWDYEIFRVFRNQANFLWDARCKSNRLNAMGGSVPLRDRVTNGGRVSLA